MCACVPRESIQKKMFASLVLLALTSWNCRKVTGERCEFPADHPDLAPEPRIDAQFLEPYRLYEYTNQFDSCHGYVGALHFCYRPGNADSETLFTIEILGPGNGPAEHIQAVVVHANSDRENCMTHYNPTLTDCCIVQELPEPFPVNSNHHYALRVHGGTASILLRHELLMTDGRVMDLGSGNYLSDSVMSIPSPLFFFRIEPESCSGPLLSIPQQPSIQSSSVTLITATQLQYESLSITTTAPATTSIPSLPSCVPPQSTGCVNIQEEDDINSNAIIIGAVISSILLLITATVMILVLCRLRRKGTHIEVKTDVMTTTNEAYDTVKTDVTTTANEAYDTVKTDVMTTANEAYDTVKTDVMTTTNEAYALLSRESGVTTAAVNPAYGHGQVQNTNTLQYDYITIY